MKYVIDSYAWVEYLLGSKKGETLKKLFMQEGNEFLTVECCLAEMKGWCLKNNQDFNGVFTVIRANSMIIALRENDSIKAADERFEQRKRQKDFGLIDALILVKQKEFDAKIISGDKHFKELSDVVFIS